MMNEPIDERLSGPEADDEDDFGPSGGQLRYILLIVSLALFFVAPLSIESGEWSSQFTEMLDLASEDVSGGRALLHLVVSCSLMTFAAPVVAHQAFRSETPRSNRVRLAFAAQTLLLGFGTFGHGFVLAIATMVIGFGAGSILFEPVFLALLFLDLVAVGWSILLAVRPWWRLD